MNFEELKKNEALTDGEKGFVDAVENAVTEKVQNSTKGLAKSDDMEAMRSDISKEITSIKAMLEKKANEKGSLEDVLYNNLKDYITTENGRKMIDFGKLHQSGGKNITIKAAGLISEANSVNAAHLSVDEVEMGVAPRDHSPIYDISFVYPTDKRTIVIPEYAAGEGDAAWTAEGAAKPLVDADLTERTVAVGKVAVRAKFSREVLEDFADFCAEVRNDMISRLANVESVGILYGTGTGGQITGVSGTMATYVATGIEVVNPNMCDALKAAYAQIQAYTYQDVNYKPNAVLVNVIDLANMDGLKDSTGRNLFTEYKEWFDAVGVQIIPVSSSVVAVGKFIMGDFQHLVIRPRTELEVQVGWENDDFSKNLVTVIAERRLAAYIKTQHQYAFVYDEYANVITAITPSE